MVRALWLALLVVPPLADRLARLDPATPIDYLEAGEDAARDGETALARQLYRRAGALACGAKGTDPALAASAALALAALEDPRHADSAWVRWRALARMIAPDSAPPQRFNATDAERLRFATLLSHYRAGRAVPAQRLGRDASCIALAQAWGALLPGGADGFLKACATLSAAAPPQLSPTQLDGLLALERALLSRAPRALDDLRCGRTAPSPELDPSQPAQAFGVDDGTWWWRNGAWSATK